MNISGKNWEVSDDLQELLVPFVLDYPNSDALKLKEQKHLLEDAGIYLEEFGQTALLYGPILLGIPMEKKNRLLGDDRYAADNWKCECKKIP